VVCVSAYACQQIFLSSNSAVHRKWSVAGSNNGEEHAAKKMNQVIEKRGLRQINFPKLPKATYY
jgi:hypothetical protein